MNIRKKKGRKKIHKGREKRWRQEGWIERNEDSTQGTAAVSEVINVVLTRVYQQARRSQFSRRNKGQFKSGSSQI